jgi:diguanylate cyclase (GGDEF)-like protein
MQRLRDFVAKSDNSYAGVDMANAARIGSAIWLLGGVLAFALLPLAPPTEPLGDSGWIPASALVLVAFVAGYALRRRGESVTPGQLLWHSYWGVIEIALMVWLTGGIGSPWAHLFLLNLLYTVGVHPPRPAIPFLAFFVAVFLAPLAYDSPSGKETLNLVTELGVWMVFAGVAMALMVTVRGQRLGLRREGERARRQARVDQLTGLQNRRAFDEALSSELQRARAAGEPLSVLIADLDRFKEINDRFGHLEGDRLLKAVADAIQVAIRGPDAAYRWGGDEFAVILPGTTSDGAGHVAKRIRAAVAQNFTPDDQPIGLAIGCSELGPGTVSAASLLGEADHALLRAKGGESVMAPGAPG